MQKNILKNYDTDSYELLSRSCHIKKLSSNRSGAILSDFMDQSHVPLVRTTNTKFETVQPFKKAHRKLIENIRDAFDHHDVEFNNAQVDCFRNYKSMSYHSDMTLDLKHGSSICIFSCYPSNCGYYKPSYLSILNKQTGVLETRYLEHNSVVLFSLKYNSEYLHKIVSPSSWLGITFRMSKTFLSYVDERAFFVHNKKELRIANYLEYLTFCREKGWENKSSSLYFYNEDYDFTLNQFDLKKPLQIENTIDYYSNILLVCHPHEDYSIVDNFCGHVIFHNFAHDNYYKFSPQKTYFLCGTIDHYTHESCKYIFFVKECCNPTPVDSPYTISKDSLPINHHGVAIELRNVFSQYDHLFTTVKRCHHFGELTESTKTNKAFRTGLYMSNVVKSDNEQYSFNLMRCSSNFSNATENFRFVDRNIIQTVQSKCDTLFEEPVSLNHVLAQIYNNLEDMKRATLKAHSDKTKDMAIDSGVIAFCSFYDVEPLDERSCSRLKFKLKDKEDMSMVKTFTLTLLPNSVIIIPLSTNRLYTHEIKSSLGTYPSTRMGYVIRCSKQRAVSRNGETFLLMDNGDECCLTKPNPEEIVHIKGLYLAQNNETEYPDFMPVLSHSLNEGDFMTPIY